jgi:hypothetical protein
VTFGILELPSREHAREAVDLYVSHYDKPDVLYPATNIQLSAE